MATQRLQILRPVCCRAGLDVSCLNRRQRRDRAKNPGKYKRRISKTEYPPVSGDENATGLVEKTTGLETGMAVTWLGTSSGNPTPYRNVSSILLRMPERVFVFDAGEGTQVQLLKSEIFPASIKRVFVTHLHGDHCFGLPGLLSLVNDMRLFHNRGEMIYVYGPPGLGDLMRMSLPHWFDRLRMPITIVEFSTDPFVNTSPRSILANGTFFIQNMPPTREVSMGSDSVMHGRSGDGQPMRGLQWDIDVGDNLTVTAARLRHRVPCWGYVIKEADHIPTSWEMDLWRKRQPDETVVNEAIARTALAYRGRKVVILGDTCNSDAILSIGQNADLLSHEATFSNEMLDKALSAGHSTAKMAGGFARALDAKQLVLTHFSARYGNGSMDADEERRSVEQLVAQAKEAFGKEAVIAAEDFTTVHVPKNRNVISSQSNRAQHSLNQ